MAKKPELPEPDMRGKKPKMKTFLPEPDMRAGSEDRKSMQRRAKMKAIAKRSSGKSY